MCNVIVHRAYVEAAEVNGIRILYHGPISYKKKQFQGKRLGSISVSYLVWVYWIDMDQIYIGDPS
jgi:hypothetical protein